MVPVRYNLRSLAVRKTTTIATALGIGLVVFVLASALMLQAGIQRAMALSGHADTAVVLRKGSDTEMASNIEEAQVGLILSAPGVKHDEKGRPLGVGELVGVVAMNKVGSKDGGIANVQFRGVAEGSFAIRPEVKIVAGSMPKPGSEEAIVGQRLAGRFEGLAIGQSFEIRKNRKLTVVGIFEAAGSSFESEVWIDRDAMRAAYGREGLVSSVRVELESKDRLEAFKTAVESDKNLGFEALGETEYFEKQSEGTSVFVGAMGFLIALFFSFGAMIGAAITMYAAIANRQREIGTLRALGFSRTSILVSFLLESVALSLVGGAIGAAAALAMGAVKFSMMNFQTWSEMTFRFTPTPPILLTAFLFAATMGIAGGFFPALRAARTSPVKAMRG